MSQRLKQFPRESSGGILWDASNRGAQKKEKQVRFAGGEAKRDGGAHSGPTYPEPNLPRLGRTFKKLETSITRPGQSLADTLGRRVKVNTKVSWTGAILPQCFRMTRSGVHAPS